MKENRSGRLRVWTPLLFSLIMVLGMSLGFKLRDTLRYKRDIQAIIMRNDRLEQIIDLITERYVDSVNTNLLYKDAVNGIISHLDPHTVYIPAEELQGVNEDLEGSFFGIGVEFFIIRDTIHVTSVVEGGPAQKAGISVGDKFIKVEDSLIAGNGITSEGIIALLRGKQHTDIRIQVKDVLKGQYKDVVVTRDVIPLYSVETSLMLDSTTGYIRISRFSATTFDEFMKSLKGLNALGMSQLILDLRQNPGGYLDPAVKISDQLLEDKHLIVYTEGRKTKKESYNAGDPGLFESGGLVVLVDENSASASEIIAGAVQDWDRGIVVGRRTFGKGLVQEQYNLDDGSALRLTVARYYTPSGRSIQRPFVQGREAYHDDYIRRLKENVAGVTDTTADSAEHDKYYTNQGRIVYGGGGITPDVFVPYDTARLASGLMSMIFSEELRDVLWDYYVSHQTELSGYKTIAEFEEGFTSTSRLVKAYLDRLPVFERAIATKILSKPSHSAYFEVQVKAQMAKILFKNAGYYKVSARADDMIQKALQLLRDEQAYSEIIGR